MERLIGILRADFKLNMEVWLPNSDFERFLLAVSMLKVYLEEREP